MYISVLTCPSDGVDAGAPQLSSATARRLSPSAPRSSSTLSGASSSRLLPRRLRSAARPASTSSAPARSTSAPRSSPRWRQFKSNLLCLFLKLLGPGAENWRNSWFLHRVCILLKRKFCHYFFKQNFQTNFDFLTQSLSWGSYILNSHRKIDNPVIAFTSMNAKLLNATLKSLVLKT